MRYCVTHAMNSYDFANKPSITKFQTKREAIDFCQLSCDNVGTIAQLGKMISGGAQQIQMRYWRDSLGLQYITYAGR